MSEEAPLWTCVRCGRSFANRNQTHACRPLTDLDDHFRHSRPVVREIFDEIVAEVEHLGPVSVLAETTRIALQARMSFAAFVPRRDWLDGHVILSRRLKSDRFSHVEVYSPRNVLHRFRLHLRSEVDDEVREWLRLAMTSGCSGTTRTEAGAGAPGQISAGLVTALIGTPDFIWLLWRAHTFRRLRRVATRARRRWSRGGSFRAPRAVP